MEEEGNSSLSSRRSTESLLAAIRPQAASYREKGTISNLPFVGFTYSRPDHEEKYELKTYFGV